MTNKTVEILTTLNRWIAAEIAGQEAQPLKTDTVYYCPYCQTQHADNCDAGIKAHIEQCEKHPMAALKAENAELRERLAEANRELNCRCTCVFHLNETSADYQLMDACYFHTQQLRAACERAAREGIRYVLEGHEMSRLYDAGATFPRERTELIDTAVVRIVNEACGRSQNEIP